MEKQDKPKWYFKSWSLVISFLCVGPFMLPLVWVNPSFNKKIKVIVTIIILGISVIMALLMIGSLKSISSYYQLLSAV